MKMYSIPLIIEILQDSLDSGDQIAGFEINERKNLVIVLKQAEGGCLGAQEIEFLQHVEEY